MYFSKWRPLDLILKRFRYKYALYLFYLRSDKQLMEIAKDSTKQDRIDEWFPSSSAKVHRYFLDAFKRIMPAIEPYLQGNKKVIFTGHSLGGALASLLALKAATMEVMILNDNKENLIHQSGVCLQSLKKRLRPILSCRFLEYAKN